MKRKKWRLCCLLHPDRHPLCSFKSSDVNNPFSCSKISSICAVLVSCEINFSRLYIPFLCFPLSVGAQEFCCPYRLFSGYEYFCSRGKAAEKPSARHRRVCMACFLGHEFLKMCQQKLHSCLPGLCSPARPLGFTSAVFMIKAIICLSGVQ